MRRLIVITFAALSVAACSSDTTGPATQDLELEAGAFGTALTSIGGYEPELYQTRLTNALPDEIKLTADQQAKIKALVEAYVQATKADREVLMAILREARQAIEARKSPAEIRAILLKAEPFHLRLMAAEAKLKADIDAVLTPEQRAWIAAHTPQRCDPSKFPPLSEAQKAQIRAIEAAFQQSNKADLDAVKAILEQAAAALRAGKSREEVAAILSKAAPIVARLETARKSLRDQILAVLTPEQKASGCFPLG